MVIMNGLIGLRGDKRCTVCARVLWRGRIEKRRICRCVLGSGSTICPNGSIMVVCEQVEALHCVWVPSRGMVGGELSW